MVNRRGAGKQSAGEVMYRCVSEESDLPGFNYRDMYAHQVKYRHMKIRYAGVGKQAIALVSHLLWCFREPSIEQSATSQLSILPWELTSQNHLQATFYHPR